MVARQGRAETLLWRPMLLGTPETLSGRLMPLYDDVIALCVCDPSTPLTSVQEQALAIVCRARSLRAPPARTPRAHPAHSQAWSTRQHVRRVGLAHLG